MSNQAQVVTRTFTSYAPMEEGPGDKILFNQVAKDQVGYTGYYCDFTVSSVFAMCGLLDLIHGFNGFTPTHLARFKAAGEVVPISSARMGDLVFYDWDWNHGNITQHVGLARGSWSGGWLPTVEGNTSPGTSGSQFNGGGVYLRQRPRAGIRAVCRPRYGSKDIAAPWLWVGYGMRGERIASLQRALHITADGEYGDGTTAAVVAAQKRLGMKPTGYIGSAAAWAQIVPQPKPTPPKPVGQIVADGWAGTLTQARARQLVKASSWYSLTVWVQRQLVARGIKGYDGEPLTVDGQGLLTNGDGPTDRTNTLHAFSVAMGVKDPSGSLDAPSETVRRWQADYLNKGKVI